MAAPKHLGVPESVPGELRIVTADQGATTTIEFEGECDLGQHGATRDAVALAVQRRRECLVLDLGRLSFIDLDGFHALMETPERCAAQGTRLGITPPTGGAGSRAARK